MPERASSSHDPAEPDPAGQDPTGQDPAQPDRITGRPLSPRGFRPFGIEAVLVGPPVIQSGLIRRDGVALWRRLPQHAALFDRVAGRAAGAHGGGDVLDVRVVIATTTVSEPSLRVPVLGARAERISALSAGAADGTATLAPASGCLLLVDEGPGEIWLYLAGPTSPEPALGEFLGRRGRTDFARARRRARRGGLASLGIFAAFVMFVYAQALGLGVAGHAAGGLLLATSLVLMLTARPR